MAKETETAEPEVKEITKSEEKPVAIKESVEEKSKPSQPAELSKADKASAFDRIIRDCKDKGLITRERAANILGVPQSKLGEK